MGLFVLFIFTITEIALAALTLIKWPAKADFRRNRLLATAAEFLLLALIMVLPTTYLKWRFAVAVGLAGIRLGKTALVDGVAIQIGLYSAHGDIPAVVICPLGSSQHFSRDPPVNEPLCQAAAALCIHGVAAIHGAGRTGSTDTAVCDDTVIPGRVPIFHKMAVGGDYIPSSQRLEGEFCFGLIR